VRHLIYRANETATIGLHEASALKEMQCAKKKDRDVIVGGAAQQGQAPGPRRGSSPGLENAFVKFSASGRHTTAKRWSLRILTWISPKVSS